MATCEDEDSPIPSFLEGVSLKRFYGGPLADEQDSDNVGPLLINGSDED